MFSISTLVKPCVRRGAGKALNFWHYFDGITAEPEASVEPFLKDMETKLGISKRLSPSDYAGIIRGMRFNKVDIALGMATSPPWKRWIVQTAVSLPRPLLQMALRVIERADRQQRQPDQ